MARGSNTETKVIASTRHDNTRERMLELAERITYHKNLYYNGEAEITDAEFDGLEFELEGLREQHPELADTAAPLDQVGAVVSSGLFEKVRHDTPMLSLDKVHTTDDLKKFLSKFDGQTMTAAYKYDGVSLSLLYEKGKLVRAATRGDGAIGEVITDNARRIQGVRSQLDRSIDCEIRGEVLMRKSDWQAYNKKNPDKPFANPRNAVSGSLRLKQADDVAKRPMIFVAYDIIVNDTDLEGETIPEQLTELGFELESLKELASEQDVLDFAAQAEKDRPSLDYDIDGAVFKVADKKAYEAAGHTSKYPRAGMAYKFTAEVGVSKIESVTWQVGKSGIIAPVAEISPLFLAGTTIRRASLHNMEIIKDRGVRVGDRIQIKRAGDVIPHIIGVEDKQQRDGSEQMITPPSTCPSCGSPAHVDGSGVVRCDNTLACPAQQQRRLIHWSGRSAADVDALGESWLEKFAAAGLINKVSDIYKIKREDIYDDETDQAKFEGMGKKTADKLIDSIETSKQVGLRRAMIGMSIPFASEGTAKRLCRAGYQSIEEVAAAGPEKLAEVEDIGEVVATSIDDFLNTPETKAEIAELRACGVNLDVLDADRPPKAPPGGSLPLAGKTVVITGTLDGVSRKEMEARVEAAGGKASSSVSAKTDYVIAGDKAGSKKSKAEKLGVAVLDQAAAEALLA